MSFCQLEYSQINKQALITKIVKLPNVLDVKMLKKKKLIPFKDFRYYLEVNAKQNFTCHIFHDDFSISFHLLRHQATNVRFSNGSRKKVRAEKSSNRRKSRTFFHSNFFPEIFLSLYGSNWTTKMADHSF